jgi:uncharacterized protein YjiK
MRSFPPAKQVGEGRRLWQASGGVLAAPGAAHYDNAVKSSAPCLGPSLFAAEPSARWTLSERLHEISGLAVTPDGRLMSHEDETATIYQIDIETGFIAKQFTVGDPAIRGDFEGLAIDGDGGFYLSTSEGRLYRFREGRARASVPFEAFDVGLSDVCEIEGLAFHQGDQSVILASKTNYQAHLQGALALYRWSPEQPDQHARPWLLAPLQPIAAAVGTQSFHPSGLEIDPRTGRLVVLAGREGGMAELDASGALLASRGLGERHPHAEGITILADGALLISDEGGKGRAHLTRYERVDV